MTILVYFLENKKILQKGNYSKSFDSIEFNLKGLKELLSKIKVKNENIVIFIDNIKMYSNVRFSSEFNNYMIKKPLVLNGNLKIKDFNWLDGNEYIEIGVINEWQHILGKTIFICNSKEKKDEILDENVYLAFLPPDLEELQKGMIKENAIPESVVNSIFNIV